MRNEASSIVGVVYDKSIEVDAVLSAAADLLRSRGIRVAGLLQRFGALTLGGKRSMYVQDISSGERVRLDFPRGPGASGCLLDPSALARAACLLKLAISSRPDVLIVNRFGRQEAEGRGLRSELADAVYAGLPTLVAVGEPWLADWDKFIGEPGHILPARANEIAIWSCQQVTYATHLNSLLTCTQKL
jgi:hypothetical protein